jgi:hypothetical protein
MIIAAHLVDCFYSNIDVLIFNKFNNCGEPSNPSLLACSI